MQHQGKHDRYSGSIFGLAVGDAMGVALEFSTPGSFLPVHDMVGGGPFNLQVGEWTDDTSMALCMAESLIEMEVFNPIDQMDRYVKWFRQGNLSSTGHCFDIGNATSEALRRYERTKEPFCGSTDPMTAGNGSIMRLAPVPLFYSGDITKAVHFSGESSRTTHGAREAVDACRYLGALIVTAVQGISKEELLSEHLTLANGIWTNAPLCEKIMAIARGSYKSKNPPHIRGTGYVVQSLEAALWAFYNSDSFAEGLLHAVNLGEDADTTGAVYGQLAGAYYGISDIPKRWLAKIVMYEKLSELVEQLFQKSPKGVTGI
jgi:ADP-ribosyl-[dinitrogen reductase] hydrolase